MALRTTLATAAVAFLLVGSPALAADLTVFERAVGELPDPVVGTPADDDRAEAAGRAPTPPTTPPTDDDAPVLTCTSRAVKTHLRRYVALANRGRTRALRNYFSTTRVPVRRRGATLRVVDPGMRGFRWYTVAPSRSGVTRSARTRAVLRSRVAVLRYLRVRRRAGEQLRLVAVTGFRKIVIDEADHAGVSFLMRRRARDMPPRRRWRTVRGRALVDCQSGTISAFSI